MSSGEGVVTHHQTCVCGNDIDSHFEDTRTEYPRNLPPVQVKFRGACSAYRSETRPSCFGRCSLRSGVSGKTFPRTRRNAARSLRFVNTSEGRVIVGAFWLRMRIVSNTRDEATQAALDAWARGGEV